MILNCNACGKKFVVPDQAITPAGRMVQCGSCGNKWKQFPIRSEIKKSTIEQKTSVKKTNLKKSPNITNIPKPKKKKVKKNREINLYSPEYLAKKHGIKLNEDFNKTSTPSKVSFGFYNSLLLLIVSMIAVSKSLYFFQDFIIELFPFTSFYLDYFFESIRNMFEIWKNLISSY